jgi:hypothetical protein
MIDSTPVRTTALERAEQWLSGISSPDGYLGPSLSRASRSMLFCGPGFDWRYAGLLDGYTARYDATGNRHYLDLIQRDISAICSAQLKNGTFKNSSFDTNPIEGGVPHEQLMLAAACRAQSLLKKESDHSSDPLMNVVERHIREHLIKRLWNPTLGAFGNRPVSQFEQYDAVTQSAAIELLVEFGTQTGTCAAFEPHIQQAASSLVNLQATTGADAGGIATSNRPNSCVSLYVSTQCLPALKTAIELTSDTRLGTAKERLEEYILRRTDRTRIQSLFERNTFIPGLMAALPSDLSCAGIDTQDLRAQIIAGLLPYQQTTGAFPSIVDPRHRTTPHWTHVFPVCGWIDKIYRLLASEALPSVSLAGPTTNSVKVRIGLRTGTFIETDQDIRINGRNNQQPLYRWMKTKGAPDICKL